jgi:hypothetical protein
MAAHLQGGLIRYVPGAYHGGYWSICAQRFGDTSQQIKIFSKKDNAKPRIASRSAGVFVNGNFFLAKL